MKTPTYQPPLGLKNPHLQTIWPTLFRRVALVTKERERITTPDGDFLDLDWTRNSLPRQLAILTHGLEGHSRGHYCQGMAAALQRIGWDVLAWNFRGCSGQPNQRLRSYHSGTTDDLQHVLEHVFSRTAYNQIVFVGFSLGGNVLLKYLGDSGADLDPRIIGAVAISVPCDLASSARRLEAPQNRIYMARFLQSLRRKVREKSIRFPDQLDLTNLDDIRTFAQFDDRYTAPIHGFADAEDYWARCSSRPGLHQIRVPTLLLNALDDPFLTPHCFPLEAAEQNPFFYLETPDYGGHLGFVQFNKPGEYWSETRTVNFLRALIAPA